MLAAQQFIFSIQIPETLSERDFSFSWMVGLMLFCCLVLMALARTRQTTVYYNVAVGMIKTQSLRVYLREAMPLRSGASLLLLVNYWISTGLLVYLVADHFEIGVLNAWILAIGVPLVLLFLHFFSLVLSGWVTGEVQVFRTPIAMKIVGTQVLGILYFLCATFWILQPDYVEITLQVAIWIFIVESTFRILKSVLVVLRQGVTWYYIILYFCTLEILPFLLVYYFGTQGLVG